MVDLIAQSKFKIELEDDDMLKPRCFMDDKILKELWNP